MLLSLSLCSKAERFKQEGNAAYKAGDYKQAKALYSQAIFHCPGCATYYGNRSAASLMLEEYGPALDDCTRSTQLDENFTKVSQRSDLCCEVGVLLIAGLFESRQVPPYARKPFAGT